MEDPGRPPINATVVATRGREVVAEGNSERLLRRNRNLVRPTGEVPAEPVEPQPREQIQNKETLPNTSGSAVPQSTEQVPGVVAPVCEEGVVAPDNSVVSSDSPDNTFRIANNNGVVAPERRRNSERMTNSNRPQAVTRVVQTRSGREVRKPQRLNL